MGTENRAGRLVGAEQSGRAGEAALWRLSMLIAGGGTGDEWILSQRSGGGWCGGDGIFFHSSNAPPVLPGVDSLRFSASVRDDAR